MTLVAHALAAPTSLPAANPRILVRRCACGGTPGVDGECAACRAKRLGRARFQSMVEIGPADDAFERQAGRVADTLVSGGARLGPPGGIPARPSVGGPLPPAEVGRAEPLPTSERAFMEARLGADFGAVRVHRDERAAVAAEAVDARAFTVGSDVVFGAAQWAPGSEAGRRLLAHELTHVMQHHAATGPPGLRLRRTPASKVSCAPGPLNVPGAPALAIADPVATITDAETSANTTLDAAISELDFAIGQIRAGGEPAWPTISDSLGHAMTVMGLDPNDRAVWTGRGIGSAGLLLRRLRAIRSTIGAGSFFFTCVGPANGTIGACTGTICGTGANAASCAGSFRVDFCRGFWEEGPEAQGETVLHESSHNFADFIQDAGREGNAGCYSRFAQIAAGVDLAFQRADLCPDP